MSKFHSPDCYVVEIVVDEYDFKQPQLLRKSNIHTGSTWFAP